MCGLYGLVADVLSGFTNTDMDVVVASAWINQWRGQHSSGMVNVNNKGGYRMIKDTGGVNSLFNGTEWETFRAETLNKGKIFYGHGRYATRGKVSVENAHPFAIGKDEEALIFMHNGTLGDHQQLPGFANYTVDSEWLGNMILEHGPQHALSHVSGAIACMWYDFGNSKFYIYRNHERPLFVVEYGGVQSKRNLINSEIAALMWLKEKYALPFERTDIKEFRARTLYSIDPFNVRAGMSGEHIEAKHDLWAKKVWTNPATKEVSQPPFQKGSQVYEQPRRVTYHANAEDLPKSERSYSHDVLLLLKGLADRIEFDSASGTPSRWTFWTGGHCSRDNAEPYENGLIRLSRVDDQVIRKHWMNGNGTAYSSDVRFDVPSLEKVVREVETPKPITSRPATWSSHKGTLKINHRGTIIKYINGNPHYETYENDSDGVITIGDTVQVEVVDVEQMKDIGLFRAICVRLTKEQERCITYMFSKSRWTEDELWKIGHFEGKISVIRRSEGSGYDPADVTVLLSKVHPLFTGTPLKKDTDEEAMVVINTEAQNDK
jgi:glutamine amidotransferase-like protein